MRNEPETGAVKYAGQCQLNLSVANDICPSPFGLDLDLHHKADDATSKKFSLEYFETTPKDQTAVLEDPIEDDGEAPEGLVEAEETFEFPISLDRSVQTIEGYKFTFDCPLPDRLLSFLGPDVSKLINAPQAEIILAPGGESGLISAGLRFKICEKDQSDKPLTLNIALGSPMVQLQASVRASAYVGLLGTELQLEEFTGAKIALDLFSANTGFVMNNLWSDPSTRLVEFDLIQAIPQEELKDYRFLWSGPGALRVNTGFLQKLFNINNVPPTINSKALESLTAALPGSDDQINVTFEKSDNSKVNINKDGPHEINITVPLVLKVVRASKTPPPQDNPNKYVLLNGPCDIRFKLPLKSENGMVSIPTGALNCEAESTLTIEKTDGLHQELSDLMSLHIPHGSSFHINLNAANPVIEWLRPADKPNQTLSLRMPSALTKNQQGQPDTTDQKLAKDEAEPSHDRFVFELETFALRSAGLDLQGSVKPLRFSFDKTLDQQQHIFTEPLATKKPDETGASVVGKLDIRQSKLISASIELSGKLPYFDNATGNLHVHVSEKVDGTQRTLSCLGVFEIAGLEEFHIAPLFARCQVQSLTLTTKYEEKKWINEGRLTGRVEFGPPPGRSASEMGLISELFNGVSVSVEDLKLNDIGATAITITCPPRQFNVAEVIRVDLRGITIGGKNGRNSSKQFKLLGDLSLKKLPGIDSSLTFGGIELIQGEEKRPPGFTISKIGCEISTAGGFSLKGALERKDDKKEFGFQGNFQLSTAAIPGVEGFLKLTRIKTLDDAWVPSMAVFMAKDFESPLFAGLYLREIGAGMGVRQFLRGLEPQPGTTVSQRVLRFVDDPAGLPSPLNGDDWIPDQPESTSSPMTWLLVGAGLITYGKLPPNQEHPFVGSLLLSVDQDLQTVLAVNAWLFMSPEKSREASVNRRPFVRGAIAFAPKERKLFAYFRTLSDPAFGEKTPKILTEVLSKLQTTLMLSADPNGFVMEIGWPWETRLPFKFSDQIKGELTAGFRFGMYNGVTTFGMNQAIDLRLESRSELSAGPASVSIQVNGQGYFRTQFVGALDSQMQPYLLGDVRLGATVKLDIQLNWSISIKAFGRRFSKSFSAHADLSISITAALTAAMNAEPRIGLRGEAEIAISVCGFHVQGRLGFAYEQQIVDDVQARLNSLMPPRVLGNAVTAGIEAPANPAPPPMRWQYRHCRLKIDGTPVVRILLFPAPGCGYPVVEKDKEQNRFVLPLTTTGRDNFRGILGASQPNTFEPTTDDHPVLRWSEDLDHTVLSLEELRKEAIKLSLSVEDKDLKEDVKTLKDLINAKSSTAGKLEGKEIADTRVHSSQVIPGEDPAAGLDQSIRSPYLPSQSRYDQELVNAIRTPLARLEGERINQEFVNALTYATAKDHVLTDTDKASLKTTLDSLGLSINITAVSAISRAGTATPTINEWLVETRADTSSHVFAVRYFDGPQQGEPPQKILEIYEVEPQDGFDPALIFAELLTFMRDPRAGLPAAAQTVPYSFAPAMRLVLEFKDDTTNPLPIDQIIDFNRIKESIKKSATPTPAAPPAAVPTAPAAPAAAAEPVPQPDYCMGGDPLVPLESVLGAELEKAPPQYDLVPGNYFQSREQICLTWELLREDPINITSLFQQATAPSGGENNNLAQYAELEKYVVIRDNRSQEKQILERVVYPAWVQGKAGGNGNTLLIRPQFQFYDQDLKGVNEGDLLVYRIQAHAVDGILAETHVVVQRKTIVPLAPLPQPTAFQYLSKAENKITEAYEIVVPINAHDEPVPTAAEVNSLLAKLNAHSNSIFAYYNPDLGNYAQGKDTAKDEKARELLTVVSLIQRFQVRYRKQHASPVGPYGFSESSYEENRWVDPVPTRQATTEPREIFPEVRFAEAPHARPMPWDSVKEIQGLTLEYDLLLGFHENAAEKARHAIGLRIKLNKESLTPGQAIELYVGLQDPVQANDESSPEARRVSPLTRCRHAIWVKTTPEDDSSHLLSRDQRLNLEIGNAVRAFETIPEAIVTKFAIPDRTIDFLPRTLVTPEVIYPAVDLQTGNREASASGDGSRKEPALPKPPTVGLTWLHQHQPPRIAGQETFNPIVGYRIHGFDRYDPRHYTQDGTLSVQQVHQQTVEVLPEELYRAYPTSILPRSVSSEKPAEKPQTTPATVAPATQPATLNLPDWVPVDSNTAVATLNNILIQLGKVDPKGATWEGPNKNAPSTEEPRITYQSSAIFLEASILTVIQGMLNELARLQYKATCEIHLTLPLVAKLQEAVTDDVAKAAQKIVDMLETVSKDLTPANDPYGWLAAELLGLSCECHFYDQARKPIHGETLLEAYRTAISNGANDVSLYAFLGLDQETHLNVVRLAATTIMTGVDDPKDPSPTYVKLKKRIVGGWWLQWIGYALARTREFKRITDEPFERFYSETILKDLSNETLKTALNTCLDTFVYLLRHTPASPSKGSESPDGTIVMRPALPQAGPATEATTASNQAPCSLLPIRHDGWVNLQIPGKDIWSHWPHYAIEPIGRYDRLTQILFPAVDKHEPYHENDLATWNHVTIDRTKPLAPQGLIASANRGSILVQMMRHPASFASTSAADHAAFCQFHGHRVFLERRPVNPWKKVAAEEAAANSNGLTQIQKELSDLYTKVFSGLAWSRYKDAVQNVLDGQVSVKLDLQLVQTNSSGTLSPYILEPIETTTAGVYGIDQFLFRDLHPGYEYRAHGYASAGRLQADAGVSGWLRPIIESDIEQPTQGEPKAPTPRLCPKFSQFQRSVLITPPGHANEQIILTFTLPLATLRDLLPPVSQPLWDRADITIDLPATRPAEPDPAQPADPPPVSPIPLGFLPDLEVEYQIFIRTNVWNDPKPIFDPFVTIGVDLTSATPAFKGVIKRMTKESGSSLSVSTSALNLTQDHDPRVQLECKVTIRSEDTLNYNLLLGILAQAGDPSGSSAQQSDFFAFRLQRQGALSRFNYTSK